PYRKVRLDHLLSKETESVGIFDSEWTKVLLFYRRKAEKVANANCRTGFLPGPKLESLYGLSVFSLCNLTTE
ncbi:hypothetical protein, partial [Fretibacterium sp. OH1220_COT-178]|uniref:hypothetical protein n=1 Tax=Fretibacterium sp. OH1220_COT-178 TaxID=2491047 RepID=UPI001F43D379